MSFSSLPFSPQGLLFLLSITLTLYLYSSVFIIPSIILLPLSIKYSGLLAGHLFLGHYCSLFVAALEMVFGVKVVVSGDTMKFSNTRPTLIISNHRCKVDWLLNWCLLFRMGSTGRHRCLSKNKFSEYTFIGWATSMSALIWIRNNWTVDKGTIIDTIRYYSSISLPVQLVLFPEGTCLNKANLKKSHDFARKNGLELYEYVLHPRTKGFVQSVKSLKEVYGEFDICNVTTGFIGNITHGEMDTVKGGLPTEMHFNVERIPFAKFKSLTDSELEQWVEEEWKRKENRLKEFYQKKSFSSAQIIHDSLAIPIKKVVYLALCLITYFVFFYYFPWTLLTVVVFGMISLYVKLYKGGWTTLILKLTKNKTD